jgi:small-conductance mechanosensitive channel
MHAPLTVFQNIDPLSYLVLALNLLLLIAAPYLVRAIYHEPDGSPSIYRKVRIIRALSVLIFIAYFFFFTQEGKEHGIALKTLGVLGIIYLSYLLSNIAAYFIIRHYGHEREIKGKLRRVSTYHTRLLSIFTSIFISVMALISIIQLLEFDSALKAGGVVGFIGVFLALTNSVWAPDIFSGLIILNSDMLEEGDIIEIYDTEPIYALVYKTKVFHTVILNLVDNHRVMIRNAKLRDFTVHNLSKFASAKGLRESLVLKIGYDVSTSAVRKMLNEAYEQVKLDSSIKIDSKRKLEIGIQDVGDHAIEWRVYYYTKAIDELPKIRQLLLEVFLNTANEHDISLSTPLTHVIQRDSLASSPKSSLQDN